MKCPILAVVFVDDLTNHRYRADAADYGTRDEETLMKYMLMFCDDETRDGPDPESEEAEAEMQAWYAYSEALVAAGVWVSGEALQPTVTTTVVRKAEGKTVTVDGPFAETKESFGGFEIIDVADLDEAISWAERSPVHPHGLVEIRPIMEIPADPEA